MANLNIINQEDKNYYNNLYEVGLYSGANVDLVTFNVYANYERQALEIVVAYAELHNPGLLMSMADMEKYIGNDWYDEFNNFMQEHADEDVDELTFANEYLNYVYVDATEYGASQPYYVSFDNLVIEEISENKVVENKDTQKVFNIKWDTENNGQVVDQEKLNLPNETSVPANLSDDEITDYLSDKYGYCVFSYNTENDLKENKEIKENNMVDELRKQLSELNGINYTSQEAKANVETVVMNVFDAKDVPFDWMHNDNIDYTTYFNILDDDTHKYSIVIDYDKKSVELDEELNDELLNENREDEANAHYIAKANLDEYGEAYLLLDDKTSSGISGLDIILKATKFPNLMYNTDYNVTGLKIVKSVSNLDELIDYMKSVGEDLSNLVTDKGIPVGMQDMLPYDLNHYIVGEEGDPYLTENKLVEDIDNEEHIIWDSEIDYYDEDYKNEIKNNQYQDYLDSLGEDAEPEDFESWYENYIDDMSYDDTRWLEEDLDENILPNIDKQLNDDVLLLSGSYGSNYAEFRPSGAGGVMFEKGIDGFKSYIGGFDRVCITTQNGILGAICSDHDGTVSGQFYTLPDDKTELIKAMGYEEEGRKVFDEYDDYGNLHIADYDNVEEFLQDYMPHQFDEDLYYGGIDASDLNKHIDLLKPIKDTISGYTPTERKTEKNNKITEENKLVEGTDNEEHIIWDSEFYTDDLDTEEMKDGPYQDYLDNFNSTVTPMSFNEWLDSDECQDYFDLEWEMVAKENDEYAGWYNFIMGYVSDEEKQKAYNTYLEDCKETTLTPLSFESWLDDNINQLSNDDWEVKEQDLKYNILPAIETQMNYDCLILSGYYGSNYPDFRASGNGGKLFDGVEEYRRYMGNFDRVTITSQNGILGSTLYDHDGTVSGDFYTIPRNFTELVKAMNYQEKVDIPEDITDEKEIFERTIYQFEEDLVYGVIDAQDLTQHIDLLVPIKDTISGYTPDPEPKNESKANEYRYITNHGIGPGTLPKDTYIRSEDLANGKTAIYLNRPLTQQELDKYDIKPEWIQESKSNEDPSVSNADKSKIIENMTDKELKKLASDMLDWTATYSMGEYFEYVDDDKKALYDIYELLQDKDKDYITEFISDLEGALNDKSIGDDAGMEKTKSIINRLKGVLNENKIVESEDNSLDGENVTSTFKNYKAFEANFEPVKIVKNSYDKNYKVYRADETDANNYIYYTNNKDNIEGWLYGAVQAINGIFNKLDRKIENKKVLNEEDEETLDEAINRAHSEEIDAIGTYDTILAKINETLDENLAKMIQEIRDDEEDHKLLLQHYIDTGEAITDEELEELKNKSSEETDIVYDEPVVEESIDKEQARLSKSEYNNNYNKGYEYLENIVKEDNITEYEIVEDTYEYENGLCLIEYEDKDHKDEIRHICIDLDNLQDVITESKCIKEASSDVVEYFGMQDNTDEEFKANVEKEYAELRNKYPDKDMILNDDFGTYLGTDKAEPIEIGKYITVYNKIEENLDNQSEKSVYVKAYGKIYYELPESEFNELSEDKIETMIEDTAYQATEEEGHTVEIDEVEILIESKEKLLKEDSTTISEELNTSVLPIVDVDMYSLGEYLADYDVDTKELDDIVLDVAPKYIEETIKELLPNVSVIAKSVYHPREYNFSGDELDFTLKVDRDAYNTLRDKAISDENFAKFLKDNYSSNSGFISTMADNVDDFETEDTWKQLVQVLMYNIPKDTIDENNDNYTSEFIEKVGMTFPLVSDDEDNLTESVDMLYASDDNTYVAKNNYGYTTLALIVDDENKQFQLIDGQAVRIGKYPIKSKKELRNMANELLAKGYKEYKGYASVTLNESINVTELSNRKITEFKNSNK